MFGIEQMKTNDLKDAKWTFLFQYTTHTVTIFTGANVYGVQKL